MLKTDPALPRKAPRKAVPFTNAQTYAVGQTTVTGTDTFVFPHEGLYGGVNNIFHDLSSTNTSKHFIFEGAGIGKGQLVMVFLKDGQEIGQGPGVWLDLRNFRDFYEHWTCGDTDVRNATIAATATHSSDNAFEYSASNDGLSLPGSETYNDYVLFVHGWRMQPWERRVFAETAFKRMYHQGYKGKCGFFSWPTEWINLDGNWWEQAKSALSDPQHYDRCEVIARKAGNGPLHGFLTSLNSRFGAAHVHVFAHSMGNVVVSEALKAHAATPLINTYIACQSADIAHAYDQNATPNNSNILVPDLYRYNPPSPRVAQTSVVGDNYYKGIASRANNKFINFANLGDNALGSWDLNQALKPDDGWRAGDAGYLYLAETVAFEQNGQQEQGIRDSYFERLPGTTGNMQTAHEIFWPQDRFTILAHIIAARSRATGATVNMGGEFGSQVDLSAAPYNFGSGKYSHSAEFLSDFAQRRSFYYQLLFSFRLSPDPLETP